MMGEGIDVVAIAGCCFSTSGVAAGSSSFSLCVFCVGMLIMLLLLLLLLLVLVLLLLLVLLGRIWTDERVSGGQLLGTVGGISAAAGAGVGVDVGVGVGGQW